MKKAQYIIYQETLIYINNISTQKVKFFKTQETVNLTKGGNKYLTDMAEYLKINGIDLLGK
jgi:hypothetical protein